MEHRMHHTLTLTRVGIDTYQEPVVYMRADCHVCRSEGFSAQYGRASAETQLLAVLQDVSAGRYADIELSAFLTAYAAGGMNLDEVVGLTRGMVQVGERLKWNREIVADKHCVGGLPGNRTTPIVVSIVAAAGVCMPKTSSRAITSPAGTADAMEVLAPVDLDLITMRRVVEREGGCIVWGGSVRLSPVDDVLIRVERALDLDSDAQMVASILSKKKWGDEARPESTGSTGEAEGSRGPRHPGA